MGAGVPRPVHPKSQTQRKATANPSTDGTAASHRQRAAPAVSTLKPSHPGSSQNHKLKNAAPTSSDATVVSHCSPREALRLLSVCPFAIGLSCCAHYAARACWTFDSLEVERITPWVGGG